MFNDLFDFINQIITQNINGMVGVFTSAILPLIGACVMFYIVYLSYQMLYNQENLMVMEVVKTIGSLAAVTTVALSTSWYLDHVVPAVLYSGDDIARALLGSDAGGGASLQAMVNTVINQINKMFSLIDLDFFGGSSIVQACNILLMILLTILGALPFIAVATAYLLIAKIAVSFLLILGPMFVMMAFFPATREIFRAWTGQCFNYILLMIMYPLAFSIFTQVLDTTVFQSQITFEKSIMVFIVFFAMVVLSVQIPVLCSTLSGGVGISGLVGSISSTARGAMSTGKAAYKGGRGAYQGGKALANKALDIGKGTIKPG
jgi:type IV secretion system protein VirB6